MRVLKIRCADDEYAHLRSVAKRDAMQFGRDKSWVRSVTGSYQEFKSKEGTEMTAKEFRVYQKEVEKYL